jgi:flagellar assembly protein FliH
MFRALAEPAGFTPDPRFAGLPVPPPAAEPEDPVAHAHAEGFAAGFAEAKAIAEAHLAETLAAREAIELALTRHNAALEEELRQRLLATVELLCAEALAPLALDPTALKSRITRAAAMLARADDERVLRLHPEDIALLGEALPDLPIEPDPALPRGSLRIETVLGGVEDGPEHWRRALAEALAQC